MLTCRLLHRAPWVKVVSACAPVLLLVACEHARDAHRGPAAVVTRTEPRESREPPAPLGKALLCEFPKQEVHVWRTAGTPIETRPFFFRSGLSIDADGAPNAYSKAGAGIDHLANARDSRGRWVGVAVDAKGRPFVQRPGDPFPGFYVSTTSLMDASKEVHDPRRYVDSTVIPYIALPRRHELPVALGDYAAVCNVKTGKTVFALLADWGPGEHIGEGSVKLAEELGIRASPKNGGTESGLLTVVFPHSGNGQPQTLERIDREGQRLLKQWGGISTFVRLTQSS